jgi:hypothetical protein
MESPLGRRVDLLRYGSGFPFNRLERLEGNLGIPLPASTQWEIVEKAAKKLEPVYRELLCQAAQGELLHKDDTSMKVLDLRKEIQALERAGKTYRSDPRMTDAEIALESARSLADSSSAVFSNRMCWLAFQPFTQPFTTQPFTGNRRKL